MRSSNLGEENNNDELMCVKWMKGMTPLPCLCGLLITASTHIIVPLTSREVVANVYLLRVLVCYMMMQVRYYLVTIFCCALNNCGSKQRSTHPIVLAKLANQRIKEFFE